MCQEPNKPRERSPSSFRVSGTRIVSCEIEVWCFVLVTCFSSTSCLVLFIQHRDKDGESLSLTHLRAVKLLLGGLLYSPNLEYLMLQLSPILTSNRSCRQLFGS